MITVARHIAENYDLTNLTNVQRVLLSRVLELYFNNAISRTTFLKIIKQWELPIIK